MSVTVAPEVFARLVGRDESRHCLLFEVAPEFVGRSEDNGWSEPVQYRFVRREGAFVELEFHRVDPDHGPLPVSPAPQAQEGET